MQSRIRLHNDKANNMLQAFKSCLYKLKKNVIAYKLVPTTASKPREAMIPPSGTEALQIFAATGILLLLN